MASTAPDKSKDDDDTREVDDNREASSNNSIELVDGRLVSDLPKSQAIASTVTADSSTQLSSTLFGVDLNITVKEGNTDLFYAVQISNNESVVRAFIDDGADVNITDNEGKTALFYAVQQGSNESVVRALIDASADVNITDNEGGNALFYAVLDSNNESVVRALLDAGADVNKTYDWGGTALFYAIQQSDNKSVVRALINANADVNITFNEGETALFYAVQQSDSESVIRALMDAGADVNITYNGGKTALFYAIQHSKNESVVRALIDAGADVNITDNEGKTALFYAVQQSDNESVVRALIDAVADVNITYNEGKTALFCAVQDSKNESVVRALIDAGADINITDDDGKTALFYAVQYSDNESVVRALIDAGVDINITDNDRKTALFYAVQYSDSESVVRALIEAGVDINVTDETGQTALFYSLLCHEEDVALVLTDAGADVNVIDIQGETALFSAVSVASKSERVVRSFIDHGVDVNLCNNEGRTALMQVYDPNDDNCSKTRALVEYGGALVDVRDHCGRTPLFYAINMSVSLANYLLDKGANPNVKDHNNVNLVSFFIERCQWNDSAYVIKPNMRKELAWFTQYGVEEKTVYNALVNTCFCKMVCFVSSSSRRYLKNFNNLLHVLITLRKYSDKKKHAQLVFTKMLRKFENMLNPDMKMAEFARHLPEFLAWLIELGANVNHGNKHGNTALHYATRLPFVGIPQETVMDIFNHLKTFGANFNCKNYLSETPLQFCFTASDIMKPDSVYHVESLLRCFITLMEVWRFCLNNGTSVAEITKSGDSVYHLILKLFSTPYKPYAFKSLELCDAVVLGKIAELMKLVSSKLISKLYFVVNQRDMNLNTPLHLWASMEQKDDDKHGEGYIAVFKHLLECGARLDDRNKDEETPLHLCKTWTAVKLLIDAGAEPNVRDSTGRSPLLLAATARKDKNMLPFFRSVTVNNMFYPDVCQEPKEFFKTVIESNLDLLSIDKNGNSVLKILITYEGFELAKMLLEVVRDRNTVQSDLISSSLLNTLCKDISTRLHWKASLVETILKGRKNPLSYKVNEDSSLHFCCRNIIKARSFDDEIQLSVHWTIAKLLLLYGATSIDIPGESGQTCLDIAEQYHPLKELLLKPLDIKDVPMLIPWTSVSSRYKPILEKTARRQECQHIEAFWYHKDHLTSGSFGLVFAGINDKDGREVAIKRIEKLRLKRREDKREIKNLTALADCGQVVRYLSFFEDKDFSYLVLELMEGNLDEYLNSTIDVKESVKLCEHVVQGISFLHNLGILHRDLKPANILYKTHPKLCLKIADFGLSRRIASTSTTVYGTNVGTRCWIAPEVLHAHKDQSKSSDIFASGLVLHYILSKRKHPFAPADCAGKSILQVNNETETNVMNGNMEGLDKSLCAEAAHLGTNMLDYDECERPTAAEALRHPLFWSKKKRNDLLIAVGTQPEFIYPRAKRPPPLTAVENDLQVSFSAIVRYGKWNDPHYRHMPAIYKDMMSRRKKPYDPLSVVELVRFIRNAYAHVSDSTRPTPIRKQLLEDFLFLEYFPNVVMEVYKAVTTHGWDQTRDEIKYAING